MGQRGGAQLEGEFAFFASSSRLLAWPGGGSEGCAAGRRICFPLLLQPTSGLAQRGMWRGAALEWSLTFYLSLAGLSTGGQAKLLWDGEGRRLCCVSWICLVAPVGLAGWIKNNIDDSLISTQVRRWKFWCIWRRSCSIFCKLKLYWLTVDPCLLHLFWKPWIIFYSEVRLVLITHSWFSKPPPRVTVCISAQKNFRNSECLFSKIHWFISF